jgi:hypothetical protein
MKSAPEARYTNYFEVGQNALEFIMDFGQYHPDSRDPLFHTSVVTGPVYAKLLLRLLTEAVERHEATHGPIAAANDDLDLLEHVRSSLAAFDTARSRGGSSL